MRVAIRGPPRPGNGLGGKGSGPAKTAAPAGAAVTPATYLPSLELTLLALSRTLTIKQTVANWTHF